MVEPYKTLIISKSEFDFDAKHAPRNRLNLRGWTGDGSTRRIETQVTPALSVLYFPP